MRPQEAIGYWLARALRGLGGAFLDELRRHCVERGKSYVITPAQFGVLSLLDLDGDQTIGSIAQSLRVDLPTITGIVNRLEQIGLVARAHGRVDRRLVSVALTEEGHDIATSARPVAERFNERALRGFSPDERGALVDLLRRLIVNVVPEAPGGRSET